MFTGTTGLTSKIVKWHEGIMCLQNRSLSLVTANLATCLVGSQLSRLPGTCLHGAQSTGYINGFRPSNLVYNQQKATPHKRWAKTALLQMAAHATLCALAVPYTKKLGGYLGDIIRHTKGFFQTNNKFG